MNEQFFKFEVVMYKGKIMILKRNTLGSQVMFMIKGKEMIALTCELGPISEFEIIGEF